MSSTETSVQEIIEKIQTLPSAELSELDTFVDFLRFKAQQAATHADANVYLTPLDRAVVQALRSVGPASVPELADRINAATALALRLPLLTTVHAIAASGLVITVD